MGGKKGVRYAFEGAEHMLSILKGRFNSKMALSIDENEHKTATVKNLFCSLLLLSRILPNSA